MPEGTLELFRRTRAVPEATPARDFRLFWLGGRALKVVAGVRG